MQAMFRSALFKLTVSYVAIIMAICIVFSGVFYHLAVTELHTGIYNQYSRWLNAYEPFGLRQPSANPALELSERAEHILWQLVYLNVIILIISSAACYWLAKHTLRPIAAAHDQQKRFTADVSHELRTPLTALRMETEVSLLAPKTSVKQLQATLISNLEEVGHMETLINNLLLLSTMEADKLRTDFVELEVEEVVTAAVRAVSKLAADKCITIDSQLQSQPVRGDRASLTQLCTILLENAIKYSLPGASVEIMVKKLRNRVRISVIDHGKGIDSQALPHIFDRFYRADSARSRDDIYSGSTQGYGLGLSLAKLIADLHDAEIVISSTAGSGTTASIILA